MRVTEKVQLKQCIGILTQRFLQPTLFIKEIPLDAL